MTVQKNANRCNDIHKQLRTLVDVLTDVYSSHYYALFAVKAVLYWLDGIEEREPDTYSMIIERCADKHEQAHNGENENNVKL